MLYHFITSKGNKNIPEPSSLVVIQLHDSGNTYKKLKLTLRVDSDLY